MLPVFLSCEIKAHSPRLVSDSYRDVASLWAGEGRVEVSEGKPQEKRGPFFGWYEQTHMTFGESVWYSKVTSLTLTSQRAIGILRPWRDADALVAVVSALPVVTSALSASLPRVLEEVTKKEIISRGVQVKLGSFLYKKYDEFKDNDQMVFMEFMDGDGRRYSIQRGHKSPHIMAEIPDGDRLRKLWADSDSEAGQAQRPCLLALGLTWKGTYLVLNRTFSVQVFDVASKLENIAFAIGEITAELLDTYLDKVEG